MRRRRVRISLCRERTLLSDILPYEVPPIFSIRKLFKFMRNHEIKLEEAPSSSCIRTGYTYKPELGLSEQGLQNICSLLFNRIESPTDEDKGDKYLRSVPFTYRIVKEAAKYRELSIIHPVNQVQVIDFYEKFNSLILYYCSISPFSIRKPVSVSRFVAVNEVNSHEQSYSETTSSYFVVKDFNSLHRFFDSMQFHRCEKKFNHLVTFDVSKCFSNIYTHTISWAVYNKVLIKENLSKEKGTFSSDFDKMMQNMSYGETNGIVIGPEFSRIFAEIILQRIDVNTHDVLLNSMKYRNKTHYQMYRYVDDYFLFYNDDKVKEDVLEQISIGLSAYNLAINEAKTKYYSKPIITQISIAKSEISSFMNKVFKNLDNLHYLQHDLSKDLEIVNINKHLSKFESKASITKYKAIVSKATIEYKDLSNYVLSICETKLTEAKKNVKPIRCQTTNVISKTVQQYISELATFIYFVYSVDVRVGSTIRICRITRDLLQIVKRTNLINPSEKHFIKQISFDCISDVLNKNKFNKYVQVESMFLLITLKQEFGNDYNLPVERLKEFLGLGDNIDRLNEMCYFSIIVILFYIGNDSQYSVLKTKLLGMIEVRFTSINPNLIKKNTELILLLFDVLSCPFIENAYKKRILMHMDITDLTQQEEILHYNELPSFTQWEGFDLSSVLNRLKRSEVY